MKLNNLAGLTSLVLLVTSPALADAPTYETVSLELYGAASFADALIWNTFSYGTEAGTGVGVGLYHRYSWLEYGLDVMSSRRDYSCCNSDVSTTSVMVVGRRHFILGEGIPIYVGLGLGMIRVNYDGSAIGEGQGSDTVKGGQISFGGLIPVGESAFFGEVRYQAAFEDASILGGTIEQSYDSTFAVIGYKLVF